MNPNQVYRIATVGVLWLCVGVGCRKDPPKPAEPECKAGCCYLKSEVYFTAKLDGALISSIGQEYIILKEPVPDVKLVDQNYFDKEIALAFVCPLDEPSFTSFNTKRMSEPGYQTQQYRIWGALYLDPGIVPFNPTTRAYAVKIDRIEEVK